MALKFSKLDRAKIRKLKAGELISEHGIQFKRLKNGDGRFSINVMVDGKRIHRVIGKESEGVTRNQAEKIIEQLKTEARHGRLKLPEGKKASLKMEEAASQYVRKLKQEAGKNIKRKYWHFKNHLLPYFKSLNFSELSTSQVDKYKHYRLEQNASNATINRELATLSHLYSKAIDWKWIQSKPCKITKLKEEENKIVYLTQPQIKRLLEEAQKDSSPYIYLFTVVALETAMRRSELLSIEWANVDTHNRLIYLPKAKAGARNQPITQNTSRLFKKHIANLDKSQPWLFPSKLSKSGHLESIEIPFRRVVTASDLDPKQVVRHTLRHTAITHLVQAGIDLPTVQRISGHKTLQMVVRYSHQNGEHIQSAMDALEQRYASE